MGGMIGGHENRTAPQTIAEEYKATYPWQIGSCESKKSQKAHMNEWVLLAPHVHLQ